ncbi:acetolactate synthase small subunit [Peptoniphilus sp. ING2-D1G]|nr:acetolactate synthase small subunit [Peptoniphilus sp. ING2-D1G]
MKKLNIVSILVENNAGILARISSMFARRGFNIESLTVSFTKEEGLSMITLTTLADKNELKQLISQTEKLEEVIKIEILQEDNTVMREIVLIKINVEKIAISELKQIADIYKASIVDLSPESIIMEITGKPIKVDAFLNVLKKYDVVEVCRTGITAMKRI